MKNDTRTSKTRGKEFTERTAPRRAEIWTLVFSRGFRGPKRQGKINDLGIFVFWRAICVGLITKKDEDNQKCSVQLRNIIVDWQSSKLEERQKWQDGFEDVDPEEEGQSSFKPPSHRIFVERVDSTKLDFWKNNVESQIAIELGANFSYQ